MNIKSRSSCQCIVTFVAQYSFRVDGGWRYSSVWAGLAGARLAERHDNEISMKQMNSYRLVCVTRCRTCFFAVCAMTTFWQPCWAVVQVDAEGRVLQPLEFRRVIPAGGVEFGKAFCIPVGKGGAPVQEAANFPEWLYTPPSGPRPSEEQPAEQASAEEGSPLHKRARGAGAEEAVDAEVAKDEQEEIDEDLLDSLRDALVPSTPSALPADDAGAAGGAPHTPETSAQQQQQAGADPARGAWFGEYKLRRRRTICKELEVFVLTKFVAASAQPNFIAGVQWLADIKGEAAAAGLMVECAASTEGLKQVLRGYQTWLKGRSA